MNLQESGEMYLETILVLSKKNKDVRSIDIARELNYSKPSVSRAIGLLKKDEYIIGSGTSISGSVHIGNSCDIFIANAVSKELRKIGENAKTVWIADD